MSVMLNYDSRDNFFTPSRGVAAEIKVMAFNGAWGSDQDFEKIQCHDYVLHETA